MSSDIRFAIRSHLTWVVVRSAPRPDLPAGIPRPYSRDAAYDNIPYDLRKSWPWKPIEGARIPTDPIEDPDVDQKRES